MQLTNLQSSFKRDFDVFLFLILSLVRAVRTRALSRTRARALSHFCESLSRIDWYFRLIPSRSRTMQQIRPLTLSMTWEKVARLTRWERV